jgi:hypothetical protein
MIVTIEMILMAAKLTVEAIEAIGELIDIKQEVEITDEQIAAYEADKDRALDRYRAAGQD